MEGVFFISFYETMLLQQEQLQQKLTDIQKQLQQLPEGKLICTRCGNRTKWYRSDGHTKTYIPKDQKPYASQLAIRRYLLEKQKEFKANNPELFGRYPKFSKALAKVLDPSDEIKPAATEEQIGNQESVLDFTLPSQVREFFLLTAGINVSTGVIVELSGTF